MNVSGCIILSKVLKKLSRKIAHFGDTTICMVLLLPVSPSVCRQVIPQSGFLYRLIFRFIIPNKKCEHDTDKTRNANKRILSVQYISFPIPRFI